MPRQRHVDSDLSSFRAWLAEHGLSESTLEVYLRDVRKGLEVGLVARLRSDDLAPKTKRHMLAAARHWAKFTKDTDLAEALDKLNLPPARRQTAKVPLSKEDLFVLLDEIDRADYLSKPMRAAIGMMACRGFRCGDVLRMRRDELIAARESGVLNYIAKGKRNLEFKVLKTYRKHLVALASAPGEWTRVEELLANGGASGRRNAAARAVERSLVRLGTKCGIQNLFPHRLRRTYAVEYLRSMKGDPEALMKLTQHMQWAGMATAMEYVDHARGDELDAAAEKMFER